MKRLFLLVLLVSACFGGGGSKSSPPIKPKPVPQSTYPQILGLGTHSLEPEALAQLKRLNVEYIRHTLYVNLWVEHPTYAITFRQHVQNVVNQGFKMLLVVHPLPTGWTPEQYASFVAERVVEFPGVESWQLGNEDLFGGSIQSHALYHDAAFRAVKAIRPDTHIVTMAWGSVAPIRAFLTTNVPFDALAVHTYGFPVSERVKVLAGAAPGKQLWITEFGMQPAQLPSGWSGNWETEQARQWEQAVNQAGKSGYARAYGYQLSTDETVEQLGIIRPDGTWRPSAFWAQKAFLQTKRD